MLARHYVCIESSPCCCRKSPTTDPSTLPNFHSSASHSSALPNFYSSTSNPSALPDFYSSAYNPSTLPNFYSSAYNPSTLPNFHSSASTPSNPTASSSYHVPSPPVPFPSSYHSSPFSWCSPPTNCQGRRLGHHHFKVALAPSRAEWVSCWG